MSDVAQLKNSNMKTLELSKLHLPFEDLLLNDDEMLVIKGGMAMSSGNNGCDCGCSGSGCTPPPSNNGCNCDCSGDGCIPLDPENTPSPTPKPGSVIC